MVDILKYPPFSIYVKNTFIYRKIRMNKVNCKRTYKNLVVKLCAIILLLFFWGNNNLTCYAIQNETVNKTAAVEKSTLQLSGIKPIYATIDTSIDYLNGVTATDKREGNLINKVVVDSTQVKKSEGVYMVTYTVTNSKGLCASQQTTVTITTADNLQNMIAVHQIDRHNCYIYGAPAPYDAGIYMDCSVDKILEYQKPAMVALKCTNGKKSMMASGFIIEITEDMVYICTNKHVAKHNESWSVYFFEGTCLTASRIGMSQNEDVAVIAVPVTSVSEELLEQLKAVHIDMGYWNQLEDKQIPIGYLRIGKDGNVMRNVTGKLIDTKELFKWDNKQPHTRVQLDEKDGDSGAAIVDMYGNFIAMVYGTAYDQKTYSNWGVPCDSLLDSYKEITGRAPYTYTGLLKVLQ